MSIYNELNGSYTNTGDVLIPDLKLSEAEAACLGKWGRMRKRYLKEHRPVLYTNLLLSEKLYPHCAEIECACEGRLDLIVRQMAEQEGVTEALKVADQMEWVRRMNSIRSRAEEIVLHELVYC
ncbi:MAG: TnpV protein [Oscillospiraceae bacterium]|nr:TnpV protein [Oscillospiraceae bacterium]